MQSEKCPVCGATVKKENLRSHNERVHLKKPGSLVQPTQSVGSRSIFRSHRRRNIILVSLIVLAVIGVSVAANQFYQTNTLKLHIHPQLTITSNSSGPVTIPAQIGIDQSLWKDHSMDQYGTDGTCPLHTHDTSGTIHIETNTVRDFTLHQFLAVWGQPSDGSAINGHPAVSLSVDGQQQASATQDVVMKDGQKIAIVTT